MRTAKARATHALRRHQRHRLLPAGRSRSAIISHICAIFPLSLVDREVQLSELRASSLYAYLRSRFCFFQRAEDDARRIWTGLWLLGLHSGSPSVRQIFIFTYVCLLIFPLTTCLIQRSSLWSLILYSGLYEPPKAVVRQRSIRFFRLNISIWISRCPLPFILCDR